MYLTLLQKNKVDEFNVVGMVKTSVYKTNSKRTK